MRWFLLAVGCAVMVVVDASVAVAQTQPWSPSLVTPQSPPPPTGLGAPLQAVVGAAIGAAAAGAILLIDSEYGRSGNLAMIAIFAGAPAGIGLAVCSLGGTRDGWEPSCGRAVGAAYVGQVMALPFAFGAMVFASVGNTKPNLDSPIVVGAGSVGWVAGMAAGATLFGRRRTRRAEHLSWSASSPYLEPRDDPRQLRWTIARSPAVVLRLLTIDF